MGQGTATMLAQIAADAFNVAPADIRVIAGDTAHVPMGHGGFASRQAVNAGNSVHIAARGVRDTTLRVAAELLGTPAEDLELDGGFVRVRGSNVSIRLGDIAREAAGIPGYALPKGLEPGQPGLEQAAHFMPTGLAYSNAAHAVEVEVDLATGAVEILRYVVASDCGRQINPMIVEGQITGGVVHGIGNALFERMTYDKTGQPLSTNFAEYLLPTASELPQIELISHVSPSPLNPLGVKGVGECGVIPAAAAIISAVEHALDAFGVRIAETPISPARILELVLSAGSAPTASVS
jgi:carbon-monoxide dehydrogenase large subunit